MCAPGLVECGMGCVNLDSDVAHCGACDNSCGPGNWSCEQGTCVDNRAWTPPTPISSQVSFLLAPRPRADSNGNATVVWLEGGGLIMAASYDGQAQSWGMDTNIGISGVPPAFAMDAASGRGLGAWAYKNMVTGDVRGAFYDGTSWEAEMSMLGVPASSLFSPRVAVDGDKSVLMWLGQVGSAPRLLARIHDGMSWGAQVPLDWAPDATWGTPGNYDLAMAPGTGFAVAVWTQNRKDLNRNVLNANGFGGPEIISDLPGSAFEPSIGIDGSNRAIVVWSQMGGDYRIYAKHFENGWSAPVELTVDASKVSQSPKVAVNEAGDAMAIFGHEDGMGNVQLWATRYDSATDTWGAAQLVDQAASGGFVPWEVAIDAAGDAVVIWRRSGNGQFHTYARHYAALSDSWDAVATLSNDMGDVDSTAMGVTADGQGNFLAAWAQLQGFKMQVFTAWYR